MSDDRDLLDRVAERVAAQLRARERQAEPPPEPLAPGWHVVGRHRFRTTGLDVRDLQGWGQPWT
jgi:hypothetical protein